MNNMKKRFLPIVALAVFSLSAGMSWAQSPTKPPVKNPAQTTTKSAGQTGTEAQNAQKAAASTMPEDSIAEALVVLAMNNPSIKSAEFLSSQFKYLYKESKTTWMNNILLQGNLNEYSINQNTNSDPLKQSTQYPRYNIGVLLPLGMFVNSPKQAKADYYKYQYTLQQVEVEKLNVRRDVLVNFHDYAMNKRLLSQHQELVNDWRVIHQKNEQKFTNGEISLDAFYNSTKTLTDEMIKEENLHDAMKVSRPNWKSF